MKISQICWSKHDNKVGKIYYILLLKMVKKFLDCRAIQWLFKYLTFKFGSPPNFNSIEDAILIDLLTQIGLDINAKDDIGDAPIHLAATKGMK